MVAPLGTRHADGHTYRSGQYSAGRRPAVEAPHVRDHSGRAWREPPESQLRERGARVSASQRGRGGPGGRLHAGSRRVRAGVDDPAAPAIPADVDHLRVSRADDRARPAARLRMRCGGLRAGSGRA